MYLCAKLVQVDSSEILKKYISDKRIQEVAGFLEHSIKKDPIWLKGLIGSSDAYVAHAIFLETNRSALFVLPSYEEAVFFMNDMESISSANVLFFPSSFKKDFDFTQINSANVLLRAEVLSDLKNAIKPRFIVSYAEAMCEKVISKDTLEKNTLQISIGELLSIDFINEFLSLYEFTRTDFVYEAGQFAIRGGIVDIFSFSHDLPYRIEFAGDMVESIRTFDPDDQLSVSHMHRITVVPNVQSKLLKDNNISFLDFIEPNTLFWIKDATFLFDVAEKGLKKAKSLYSGLTDEDKLMHPEWLNPAFSFVEPALLRKNADAFQVIECGKQFLYNPGLELKFNIRPQPSFNKDFLYLLENLKANVAHGIQNVIFADSPKQVERLYSIFEDLAKGSTSTAEDLFAVLNLSVREGFIDDDLKLACYTDHQIFDRYYKYRLKKSYSRSQALTLKELRDLKPGDYVVHIDHGIGKYAGLEKIEVNGKTQESIRLIYADNDLLYVNISSLNRISKYTGKEGTEPKMNKLGTDAWEKLKKNTKKKVKDIARDLIKLYAQRKSKVGYSFHPDTYMQDELEASFIYEDTPDQVKATADVKKDMEAEHPMDRLICGDVGFGKTEIAVRAAFKAAADGKQVAILVPTTILAFQHYKTFKERLSDFPCNVEYISRFRSNKEIKETLERVKEGKTEILIGTHRIVNKDVIFKDLGLMIIDEEQKFGVSTKEKLKEMRVNIDSLTLTATPIPRTLHFSLMGARDLSIINTPPPNRQPVLTELHVFSEKVIREAIEFEIDRGGQVFFVNNRVKDIYEIAGMLKKICPDARICVGHGQMEGHELEDVMQKFIEGKFDVLVATTIIESGLDISNANTMIINHAHQFGLSDLHQMRGRVGRSNKKAFCYLLSPPMSTLSAEARKRLSAIEEFSDLGSGFNVAMRDLDIRGAGNLLGAEQSGFIAEIGYEMYHKILDEAVQELKEDEFSEVFQDEKPRPFITFTQIETDQELLIPDEYVSSITERYNLYAAISKLENETELEQFRKQLTDRFGPLPQQVEELMRTIRLQWLGKNLGFERMVLKQGLLKCYFISNQSSAYYETAKFRSILNYVKANPLKFKLKEHRSHLILSISSVFSIHQAWKILEGMTESQLVHS